MTTTRASSGLLPLNSPSRSSLRCHVVSWLPLSSSFVMVCSMFLVLVLVVFPVSCQASITIVETGTSYASKPDHKIGQQLWKGYEYMGRLQLVAGNIQLCPSTSDPDRQFQITNPTDGLPVAIFAKTGGCTLEQKAMVASSLMSPPNIVGYLIVSDDVRRRKRRRRQLLHHQQRLQGARIVQPEEDDNEQEERDEYDEYDDEEDDPLWAENYFSSTDEDSTFWLNSLWEELDTANLTTSTSSSNGTKVRLEKHSSAVTPPLKYDEQEGEVNKELFSRSHDAVEVDDEPALVMDDEPAIVKFSSKPNGLDHGESSLIRNDETVLFLDESSQQTETLQRLLRTQNHDTFTNSDGKKINVAILHVTPSVGYELLEIVLKESTQTRQMGGSKILVNSKEPTRSAKTIFLWTITFFFLSGGSCCCLLLLLGRGFLEEEQARPPPPPVRRRLTHQQVRDKYPAFVYHPHHQQQQPLLDECAICLDEFHPGVRCRRLPCQHVFHSTCIGRWLIERSAVCPLCKIDLYEDEEEEESDSDSSAAAADGGTASFMNWWNDFTTRNVNNNNGGTPTSGAAAPPAVITPNDVTNPPAAAAASSSDVATSTSTTASTARRWWPLSITNTFSTDEQETVQPPLPTHQLQAPLPQQASSRWSPGFWWVFGRQRRRGTEGGMLTELTEPLVSSHGDRIIDNHDEAPAEVSTSSSAGGEMMPLATTSGTNSAVQPSASLQEPLLQQQLQPPVGLAAGMEPVSSSTTIAPLTPTETMAEE